MPIDKSDTQHVNYGRKEYMPQGAVDTILYSIGKGIGGVVTFFPNFLGGVIVFLIGIIVASFFKKISKELLHALKIERYLRKYGIPEAKNEFNWVNILSEIARWFIIILFLIPTAEIWGLPQITKVLNAFLLYLPNVFVGAIIGLVGLVLARLASEIVHNSTSEMTPANSKMIASAIRVTITIFVILAVLNQLGVAQDLVKILFTGFVAMIAIAGGLAFGLGGQDTARQILDTIRKKLK